jgi:hypothetical protein
MFRLDNIDDFKGLQVHVFIVESIQPTTIIGGSIVAPIVLVVNVSPNEGEGDGVNNTLKYGTSCDNDG